MVETGGSLGMLLGSVAAGVVLIPLALLLRRRLGWVTGWSIACLLWSLVVIALVTLLPTDGAREVVPAEGRLTECSMDYGGPAPEGFWIIGGTQRTLNTLLFVPAGAFLVLAVARWRAGRVLAPLGLVALAACSVLVERVQLELARLDRACDVTDVVDNVTGALVGAALGLLLALVLRPWRHRPGHPS